MHDALANMQGDRNQSYSILVDEYLYLCLNRRMHVRGNIYSEVFHPKLRCHGGKYSTASQIRLLECAIGTLFECNSDYHGGE